MKVQQLFGTGLPLEKSGAAYHDRIGQQAALQKLVRADVVGLQAY